jgi:hypothetical protein
MSWFSFQHKTYIYQPGTVQIGDHNVVQEQGTEQENCEGEDGESFSKDSQLPDTDNKTMNTDNQHNRYFYCFDLEAWLAGFIYNMFTFMQELSCWYEILYLDTRSLW